MDIDLLAKMVKELILDKDEVSLPGVGTFVAEMVPAAFSDRGYTINPPYRRLSFRQRTESTDTSLSDLYAASNGLEREQALQILTDFLAEMKEVLQTKKTIVFPELGRLRATRENNFFFVADSDLDIWPAGYGLEPISLKTHEETPEEVSSFVENLRTIIDDPAPKTVEATIETVPEAAEPVETMESVAEEVVETPVEIIEETTPEPVETTIATLPETAEPVEATIEAVEPVEVTESVAEEVVETPVEIIEETIPEPVEAAIETLPEAAEPVEATESVAEEVVETPVEPLDETTPAFVEMFPEPEMAIDSIPQPRPAFRILSFLVLAAAAALILFALLGRIAPNLVDPLLYSPEERELIRTGL